MRLFPAFVAIRKGITTAFLLRMGTSLEEIEIAREAL